MQISMQLLRNDLNVYVEVAQKATLRNVFCQEQWDRVLAKRKTGTK